MPRKPEPGDVPSEQQEPPVSPSVPITEEEKQVHKDILQTNLKAETELRNVVRRLQAARRRYEARLGRR